MDLAEARSSPRERQRIDSLMDMVPRGLASAIDVGARDGFLSVSLTDRVDHVIALDLIVPDIAHPRVTAVAGDAARLGFPDSSFDVVLCAEVLEHIASPALEVICAELVRVSRRYILIGVPFEQDTRFGRLTCRVCGHHNPPWGHVSIFDEPRLRQLFAGLQVRKVSFAGTCRSRTNFLSAALNDWAGNPWGPYWQEETCIACGSRFAELPRRRLMSRLLSKTAHVINVVQQSFQEPKPIWIHMLFEKE
jgi:hypothetical protein